MIDFTYDFYLFQILSVCEKSGTMTQFTPPEIWKRHAVKLSFIEEFVIRRFQTGYQSEDSAEDPKRVKCVQRWLRKYGSSESSLWSFWWEKNTWICWWDPNYDWQQSQHINIAKDIGVSEFLNRQVIHKDTQYFSYKIKDQFLLERKRKTSLQSFWTHSSILSNRNSFGFPQMKKKFCHYLMVNPPNNCWLALSSQDVLIEMNIKHPVYIMVFGVVTSDGDVMPSFIFPQSFRLNTEDDIKCLDREGGYWNTVRLVRGLCSMPHKQKNPVLTVRKFLRPHHS